MPDGRIAWRVKNLRGDAYDEYVGHTIAGAAYKLRPGMRARVARMIRDDAARRARIMRRVGEQRIASPPFGDGSRLS
jgi:hypothetical protein